MLAKLLEIYRATKRSMLAARVRRVYRDYRISAVVGLFLMAVATCVYGLWELSLSPVEKDIYGSSWVQITYAVAQLFFFNTDPTLISRNIWLEWSAFFAMIFILVSATTIAAKLFAGAQLAGLRMARVVQGRRHIVVCGLGRVGRRIAQDARARGLSVVAIERDQNVLTGHSCRDLGVVVIAGDAADPYVLRAAQASNAEKIFILTGADATNLSIAQQILTTKPETSVRGFLINRSTRYRGGGSKGNFIEHQPQCYVHCDEPEHGRLLAGRSTATPFNMNDRVALSLVRDKIVKYRPTDQQIVHIFLLGFGGMGQAIALWAARLGHFGNRRRLRVSIIDKDIEVNRRIFLSSYPAFCPNEGLADLACYPAPSEIDEWGSCKLRPNMPAKVSVEGDKSVVEYVCNAEFVSMPFIEGFALAEFIKARVSESVLPLVIVAQDDEALGFSIASRLHHTMYQGDTVSLPIFLWLPRLDALSHLIPNEWNITAFGEPEESGWDQAVRDVEQEARKVHDAYLAHISSRHVEGSTATKWESLTETMRESNRQQHDHTGFKLAAANWECTTTGETGADISDLDRVTEYLAEMEHNRWMAERLLAGWKFGPRDVTTRPTFVPFNELSSEERAFDIAYVQSLPDRMRAAGRPIKMAAQQHT